MTPPQRSTPSTRPLRELRALHSALHSAIRTLEDVEAFSASRLVRADSPHLAAETVSSLEEMTPRLRRIVEAWGERLPGQKEST